jgi:hypothetical protein
MIRTAKIPEKVYYYLSNVWYKGGMPTFYQSDSWELTSLLKANYPKIKEEIEAYYAQNSDEMPSNFTPYDYREKGWKTLNLYTYGLRYKANCKRFPVLDSVVRKIPGMTMTQIAVLEPGVRIKAHLGDTNSIIRNHMGISIPGKLPDIGLRVGQTEVCWEEGEVFSFCIVHRHYAWNYTTSYRIALIVDIIHPDFADRIAAVCAESLALIAMKFVATKFKFLKNLPRPVTRFLQLCLSIPVKIWLWISNAFSTKLTNA